MSDVAALIGRRLDPTPTDWSGGAMQQRIRRRYAAERRFRLLGLAAILISAGFLAFLLINMFANGARGFTQTELRLDVDFPRSSLFLDPAALRGFGAEQALANADFDRALIEAAEAQYGRGAAGSFSEGGAAAAARRGARRSRTSSAGPRPSGCRPRPRSTSPPRATAIAEAERVARRGSTRRTALRTGLNWTFLDRRRFDRSRPRSASGARSRARC